MAENMAVVLAALDALPDPVYVKDEDSRYIWVNSAFERLFAVDRRDLEGRSDIEVFDGHHAAPPKADRRVLETGVVQEVEQTIFASEAGPRNMLTRLTRMTADHEHYLVGVLHDITDVVERCRVSQASDQVGRSTTAPVGRVVQTDPLTGCANRRVLVNATVALLASGAEFGIVSVDIDHFRSINDTYGFAGGDALLMAFADMAKSLTRSEDIVARMGGEEFIIMLPGANHAVTCAVAERIRQRAESTRVSFEGELITYTVSAGVAFRPAGESMTVGELLKGADARLFAAKNAGRNAVSAMA